jgi:GNAT superfamily N-acetyltransferase
MTPPELETALDWAAAEGWNPGLDDAAAFLAADPEGFLVGRLDGEPVACISAVRHSPGFGFLGLYLCRPAWRGRGYGWALWQAGLARLGNRTVGLDGVLAQQANYRRSGFLPAGRTVRHQGVVAAAAGAAVPVSPAMLPALLALDRAASGVDRPRYLAAWLADTTTRRSLVLLRDATPVGLGTVRRCREGLKVGPLLAPTAADAEALLGALAGLWPGQPLALDLPETNPAAVALAARLGLAPVFETARMYKGPPPARAIDRVFGETSLELG